MTKSVRIVNADTSNFKVRVHAEQKDAEGNWKKVEGSEKHLNNPADLTTDYLTSHRRLVVEEVVTPA
jgi:hypothetical protein